MCLCVFVCACVSLCVFACACVTCIVILERDLGTGIVKDTVIELGLHIVGRHVGNLRSVTTGRLL